LKNAQLHSWCLGAFLTFSAALTYAAAGFCFGPFCMDSGGGNRPAVPLLYADPGVRIERPSQGELQYRPGIELQTGDIIETYGGNAVIDFSDDNFVALRDNTRIQLGSIRLFLGEVFARISQIAQRGGGQVTTDELSASVKGTEYSVRRSPGADRPDLGNTAVIVRKGRVMCEDPASRWAPQELAENNIFLVHSGQPPEPPQYVNAPAATAWADDVLRRLLRTSGPGAQPKFNVIVPAQPHREQPRRDPPRERTPPPNRPGTSDGPRNY
jgi:hypothetical protein